MLCVRGAPLLGSPCPRGRRRGRRCPRACRVIGLFMWRHHAPPSSPLADTVTSLVLRGWPSGSLKSIRLDDLRRCCFPSYETALEGTGWLRWAVRRFGYQRASGRCHVTSNALHGRFHPSSINDVSWSLFNILGLGYDSVAYIMYETKCNRTLCPITLGFPVTNVYLQNGFTNYVHWNFSWCMIWCQTAFLNEIYYYNCYFHIIYKTKFFWNSQNSNYVTVLVFSLNAFTTVMGKPFLIKLDFKRAEISMLKALKTYSWNSSKTAICLTAANLSS